MPTVQMKFSEGVARLKPHSHPISNMLGDIIARDYDEDPTPPDWWTGDTLMEVWPKYCMIWDHVKNPRNKDPLLDSLRKTYGGSIPPIYILRPLMGCATRNHESQKVMIDSVQFTQNQPGGDQCPIKVADIPDKGRGLIAKRDIKMGEVVGIYPVDWVMPGELHSKHIQAQPIVPGMKASEKRWPFTDAHTWSMYNGLLGHGDPYNPESAEMIEKEIKENKGVVPKTLETYGYTSHGDPAPETEQWRGSEDLVSECWAHPFVNHKNKWAVIHYGNDGLYKPGITKEEYDADGEKHRQQVLMNESGTTGPQPTNINLDFLCIATRDIAEGEEIQDAYGSNYWFNGVMTKDMEASVDKKNKGKLKKYKAKYKKYDTERKMRWRMLNKLVLSSYDKEDPIHQAYANNPVSFHIVTSAEGKIQMCQKVKRPR